MRKARKTILFFNLCESVYPYLFAKETSFTLLLQLELGSANRGSVTNNINLKKKKNALLSAKRIVHCEVPKRW